MRNHILGGLDPYLVDVDCMALAKSVGLLDGFDACRGCVVRDGPSETLDSSSRRRFEQSSPSSLIEYVSILWRRRPGGTTKNGVAIGGGWRCEIIGTGFPRTDIEKA